MFWMLIAGLAFGQEDPEFEETVKEMKEDDKPVAKLGAEAGFNFTSGNTEFMQLSAGLNGSYKWNKNKLAAIGGLLMGRGKIDEDGDGSISDVERAQPATRTAQKFFVDARYDRYFGELNSLYLLGGVLADPFQGYKLRSHEQFGYSRGLYNSDETTLVAEIGIDYAQELYVEGIDPDYQGVLAGRLMIGISHTIGETLTFSNQTEVFENLMDFEDLRLNNNAALSAKATEAISLKISHSLMFDNQPVTGFRPADQTTMATIVATIL